ncbi:MAG TPA: hypothetical protein VHL58_08190 [Thermoanaerobaculia bacterium]|nr:hypothetical protein [Thermoanaerobaculia bacterium]
MSPGILFLSAQLAFVLFGAPAAFLPALRRFVLPARIAAAFFAGAVLLTLEFTLFSLLSISCTVVTLSLPLLVLAVIGSAMTMRLPDEEAVNVTLASERRLSPMLVLVIILASIHLCAAVVTTRATSMDYLYTWGVRGAHYAVEHGMRPEFLKAPFNIHMHTNYPPLLPSTLAWSALAAGKTSWRSGLVTSVLWYFTTLVLLMEVLKRRLGSPSALLITALWSITLSLTLVSSMSAGSAEPPLLAFETIAVAALLTNRSRSLGLSLLTSICLAGALLTKIEGLVAVVLIAGGALIADVLQQRRAREREVVCYAVVPFACWGLWPVFEKVYGVNTSDVMRAYETFSAFSLQYLPQIILVSLRELAGPAFGVPWLLTIAVIVRYRRQWREVLPALALCAGSLAVYEGYYFIHGSDPTTWIRWTLARVTMPLLSALIVAAGLLAFDETHADPGVRPFIE